MPQQNSDAENDCIAGCCARGAIGHAAAALIGVLTVK
jgi:hypothetical protein